MALPAFGTTEWNELAAAHAFEYLKTDPIDQYFKKHPTLAHLRGRQLTRDGGNRWTWPVLDGSDAVGSSYTGLQGVTPQDVKVATMAETEPTFFAEPIMISHTDDKKAGGGSKTFDLLEQKIRHAKLRLSAKHSALIWASSKASATDPDTIPLAIPVDPTASVAFNNLNGSSGNQTWWRNQTATSTGSFSGSTLDKMDDVLNSLAQEATMGSTSLIVTTKTIFKFIQTYARGKYDLNAQVTQKSGKQMADLGIPVLNFNGIPIVHDSDCTSQKMFFFNDEALQWVAMSGGDYAMMEPGFQQTNINGVFATLGWLKLEGNLCCFERRALAQIDGTNAA